MVDIIDAGPPKDVILGGGPDANKQAQVVVPSIGPTSLDKTKSWQASRMTRFGKVVDMVKSGAVDKGLAGGGQQQVTAPGETIPRETDVAGDGAETAETETTETTEAGAQDSVGKDDTAAGSGEEETRMERVNRARAKSRADAARNRQRQSIVSQRDAEMAQLKAQNEQFRQQALMGQQLQDKLSKDPLAAFKQAGLTTEQLVQRALLEGSPEGQIEALKQLVLSEKGEREKLAKQLTNEKSEISFRQAEETIWVASRNAEKYPNLQGQPKTPFLKLVKQSVSDIQTEYMKKIGTVPPLSDSAILRYLNDLYEDDGEGDAKAPPGSKATGSSVTGKKTATASTKVSAPRTLTNRLTTATRPKNWDSLPRAEREKFLKQELRK